MHRVAGLLGILLALPLSAAVREKPTAPLRCEHAVIASADGQIRAELRLTPRRALERLELSVTRNEGVSLPAEQPQQWQLEDLPAGETRTLVIPLTAPAPEGALVFAFTTVSNAQRMSGGYRLPTAITEREGIPDEAM